MKKPQFVYVTFIRTTPKKLWDALTQPKSTRQFFFGTHQDCAWKKGATWKLTLPDGRVADSGEVLEIDPPRRLVLKWRNELFPAMRAEGYSRMTYEIEKVPDGVKFTVMHDMKKPGSKFIEAVTEGWPPILSSLKTLLETGESLPSTRTWPEGM